MTHPKTKEPTHIMTNKGLEELPTHPKTKEEIEKEFEKIFITSIDWGFHFNLEEFGKWFSAIRQVDIDALIEWAENKREVFELRKDNPQYSLGQTNGYYCAIRDLFSHLKELKEKV